MPEVGYQSVEAGPLPALFSQELQDEAELLCLWPAPSGLPPVHPFSHAPQSRAAIRKKNGPVRFGVDMRECMGVESVFA